jgi:melibiose permease/lactose/raffinose/galactose permease
MLQPRTRLYFALGNLGRTAFYSFFTGFLLSFVLYTRTLTPAQFSVISIVLVAGRLFDAVIDPFIGGMVENTRGRFGRFKPWIIAGMVFAAVGTVLLFALPLQGWAFVALLAVGNITFSLFSSINDIAVWGMLPSLTTLPEERAKLTSLTTLCGGIGGALAFALVPMLTNGGLALGGSAVVAFPVLAVLFGLLMCGMQLFSLLGVKGTPRSPGHW